jgi:hypothetical protein
MVPGDFFVTLKAWFAWIISVYRQSHGIRGMIS